MLSATGRQEGKEGKESLTFLLFNRDLGRGQLFLQGDGLLRERQILCKIGVRTQKSKAQADVSKM